MARMKKTYRINIDETVKVLAVAQVKGNKDFVTYCLSFLDMMGVPVTSDMVIDKVAEFKEVRSLFED